MSIEERRKQKFLRFVVEAKDNGGPFENKELNKGWQIWNAALDSVEIQMPSRFDYSNPDAAGAAIYDCASNIRDAGLKVKP